MADFEQQYISIPQEWKQIMWIKKNQGMYSNSAFFLQEKKKNLEKSRKTQPGIWKTTRSITSNIADYSLCGTEVGS